MPVFNARGSLPSCLQSIFAQSFEDWELIAVDDGSGDGSAEMLHEAARNDNRVRPVFVEHGGIAAALNAGMSHCAGEWVARMDSDDRMMPHRLEMQLDLARSNTDIAICGGLVRHCFDESAIPNTTGMLRFITWVNSLVTPEQIAREMFVDCPIPHPTFFLRSSLLRESGGYTSELLPEDYDLVLRLHSRGASFAKVPEVVLDWADRPDRATRTQRAYSPSTFSLLKVRHIGKLHLSAGRAFYLWGAGEVGKRFLRALQQQSYQPAALIDLDPRKIGQNIYGCPVWSTEDLAGHWTGDSLVICAVGAPGAREDIRAWMRAHARTEIRDYLFAA